MRINKLKDDWEFLNPPNLRRLADYLERYAELLSEENDALPKFDMSIYTNQEFIDNATHCGTAGCAVGHGPFAGIPKSDSECWSKYSERVFCAQPTDTAGDIWEFMFGSAWARTEFSGPGDASLRIRLVSYLSKPGSCMDDFIGNFSKKDQRQLRKQFLSYETH